MTKTHALAAVILAIATLNAGCRESPTAEMMPTRSMEAAGAQATAGNGTPAAGSGSAAVGGSVDSPAAAAGATAGAAGSAPGSMAGTRAPASAGSSGSAAGSAGTAAGSAGSSTGAGGASGMPAAEGGSGGSAGEPEPAAEIPAPATAPLIWGFGIGITDVPAAVDFYTEVMKMTVEKDEVRRSDSTETFLYGAEAMRGARLVLMNFDDMRNTRKITAKLVWQAANASAINRAASMHPDYVSRLNLGIVQFDGPETYVHEVGGIFDTGGSGISVPYPIALGFAVSDLAAARRFYTAIGMTESFIGSFSVTDVNGTGNITEYTVKFTDGAGLVLQQWSPARNATDNPIKVIVFVPDAKAMAEKVVAAGGTIAHEAERTQVYDNRLVVVAKDPDGYLIDIVE